MPDYNNVRSIVKKKIMRSIYYTDLLLTSRKSYSIYDEHDVSELTIRKLKLQLELNSILMEDAKDNSEKKRLIAERNELRDALKVELRDGIDILSTVVAALRIDRKDDVARQFDILRQVRESELQEMEEGVKS